MSRRLRMDKRGISPVVATVILVAVTIVVAVAVAYWMGGITGLYTKFEKLEIVSIYAEQITGGFNITVSIKNTGSADATIDNVLLNGKLYTAYGDGDDIVVQGKVGQTMYTLSPTQTIPLKIGETANIKIKITTSGIQGNPFVSGVSVEVRLHSAAGQEYPKTVTLP